MHGYRCFTIDNNNFPNAETLSDWMKERGFRLVVIIDPGIARDPKYDIYQQLIENNFHCTDNGKEYSGDVF
jgi:alpha-glucosidase